MACSSFPLKLSRASSIWSKKVPVSLAVTRNVSSGKCFLQKSDSWKWQTNYFKDHWNKEHFGEVVTPANKDPRLAKAEASTWREENEATGDSFWASQVNIQQHLLKKSTRSPDLPENLNSSKLRAFNEALASAAILSRPTQEQYDVQSETSEVGRDRIPQLDDETSVYNPSRPVFLRSKKKNPVKYEEVLRHDYSSSHFPSVTKVLRETMPPERKLVLQRWEENKIKELGKDGFELYRRNILRRGENIHAKIENYLLHGHLEEVAAEEDEVSRLHLQSISPLLPFFSRPFAIESHVVHPHLGYHGIVDCVAVFKDSHLVLVDWKTSERKKDSLRATFDSPLQVAAYVGALNHDERYRAAQVVKAMVVVVYNDGSQARVLQLTEPALKSYWAQWLQRLEKYRKMEAYQQSKTDQ